MPVVRLLPLRTASPACTGASVQALCCSSGPLPATPDVSDITPDAGGQRPSSIDYVTDMTPIVPYEVTWFLPPEFYAA